MMVWFGVILDIDNRDFWKDFKEVNKSFAFAQSEMNT